MACERRRESRAKSLAWNSGFLTTPSNAMFPGFLRIAAPLKPGWISPGHRRQPAFRVHTNSARPSGLTLVRFGGICPTVETIDVVKADAKSRVTIRGARQGTRFRVMRDNSGFHLEPLAEEREPRQLNPVRRDIPAPKMDLTEHLDRMRDAGLSLKPMRHPSPGRCRF